MPDMMMNETMVSYQIRFREAELERAWEHRRDLPRETQRSLLSIDLNKVLAKIPSIVKAGCSRRLCSGLGGRCRSMRFRTGCGRDGRNDSRPVLRGESWKAAGARA